MLQKSSLITFLVSLTIIIPFVSPVIAKQNSQEFYAKANSKKQLPAILRSVLSQIKRTTRIPIFLPSQLPSMLVDGQPIYAYNSSEATGYGIGIGTHPNCHAEACSVGFISGNPDRIEHDNAQKTQLAKNITGYYTPRHYKQPPKIEWMYQGISYSISLKEYLYSSEANPNSNQIKAWLIKLANSAIQAGPR